MMMFIKIIIRLIIKLKIITKQNKVKIVIIYRMINNKKRLIEKLNTQSKMKMNLQKIKLKMNMTNITCIVINKLLKIWMILI